ncbi:MAG: endolytic transglycosylase MltG [Bacilli bacterium]
MKKGHLIITILVIVISLFLAISLIVYKNNIAAVSKNNEKVEFEVMENQTFSTLGNSLYKSNLIKSELFYKIYIKLNNPGDIQKGTYILNKNMDLEEIIKSLSKGSNFNPNLVNITFKEGLNIREIAQIISENTNNKYEDIINKINDKEYIKTLITKYWFLEDIILDSRIYYPLEGYLFPETYQIDKTFKIEKILETLLNHTNKILSSHKEEIQNSKYSVHQIITLASIIELEAGNSNDRKGVAGVFYNRLEGNWSLGSDVTTYYGSKIDDFKYSLTFNELNDCTNSYNTRCKSLIGLPVGPISNPGKESIEASIAPTKHDNYYFVADCNGKTYMNKNANGHNATINKLKAEGNWCV